MPAGARGTICGLGNLIPAAIRDLVEGGAKGLEAVDACGAALAAVPVIPTVKAAVGLALDDPAWSTCMPPLRAVAADRAGKLAGMAEL